MKHGNKFGLYRDDGLGIIKATPRQIELIKKDLCALFNNHGLKITIEANKKIVNFLDVTLNLKTPPKPNDYNKKTRSRKRKIIWYNPPYSKNVSINVGQSFLKIIDEEFPADHPLHKIFNSNTVKISYSCMPNIKQTIDGHNKSTLSTISSTNSHDMCSCPKNNKVHVPTV